MTDTTLMGQQLSLFPYYSLADRASGVTITSGGVTFVADPESESITIFNEEGGGELFTVTEFASVVNLLMTAATNYQW